MAGLSRTNELLVGFSEGLSANPALTLSDVARLLSRIHERFGQFLAAEEQNAVHMSKVANETDERFFGSAKGREKLLHEATYKVQEGAASGKAICELSSQNRLQKKGK